MEFEILRQPYFRYRKGGIDWREAKGRWKNAPENSGRGVVGNRAIRCDGIGLFAARLAAPLRHPVRIEIAACIVHIAAQLPAFFG